MLTFIASRLGAIRTIGSGFIVDSDDIFIDDGWGRDVGRIVMVMVVVINLGSNHPGHFVLGR